jgi:hypothetical protein
VAVPWRPNERQIKAKIYLKLIGHSGARVGANPDLEIPGSSLRDAPE